MMEKKEPGYKDSPIYDISDTDALRNTVILENYKTTEKLNNDKKLQASSKYKRCRKYLEYLHSRENYISTPHLKTCDLHIIFVLLVNPNDCLLST